MALNSRDVAGRFGSYNIQDYGAIGDGSTDDSAAIQAAINAAGNYSTILFPPTNNGYKCSGLTSSYDGQTFVGYGHGSALLKNANAVILTHSGDYLTMNSMYFYGAGFTGNNLEVTGEKPTFNACSSRNAAGLALKATGNNVKIYGSGEIWHTTTAAGYDIEVGVSGTATLYHHLHGVYTSNVGGDGGIKLIDTGGSEIIGGQFGKLLIDAGTSPAGVGGDRIIGARILGDVTIDHSNCIMSGNLFGTLTLTLTTGISTTRIDASNVMTNVTVVSGANASNYICRQTGDGGGNGVWNFLFGPDSGAGAMGYRQIFISSGSPEGLYTAGIGSICTNNSGGASNTMYVKSTGSGNTGWKAVTSA